MFKQLQRRFILIQMSLLTLVMSILFGSIYGIAAIGEHNHIQQSLSNLIKEPHIPNADNPRLNTNLVIDIDPDSSLVRLYAYIKLDQDIAQELVSKAFAQKKSTGSVQVDRFNYAYRIYERLFGYRIVFIDRSYGQSMLNDLLMRLIVIGIASLILLYFVSAYFAKRAIQPIQNAFEKQKQFITDASHELKTPLTIMKTNLSVLSSHPDEQVSSQEKWIGYVRNQIERMSQLVTDMLDLSKVENDLPPVMSQVSLSQVVSGSALSFEALAYEQGISFTTTIEPQCMMLADEKGIERLVHILLDNAMKHTPMNGRIDLQLTYNKHLCTLSVMNTGEGIPLPYRSKNL